MTFFQHLLNWLKYPLWTLWQYCHRPMPALRNTRIALSGFARIALVGRRARRVLRRHHPLTKSLTVKAWSDKTRGRYIWRAARVFLGQPILDSLGLRYRIIGLERVDWSRPRVIVVNHQSTIDVILMVALLPFASFVAKTDILWYPYLKDFARYGGQILVTRRDRKRDMAAVRQGMQDWPDRNIVFFPEGSRSRTGFLQPFKMGAFVTADEQHLPILPILIRGAFTALPKGSLLRLRQGAEVTVVFGEELTALDVRALGPAAVSATVYAWMEQTLASTEGWP